MAEKKIMTLATQQYYDEKIKAHIDAKDAENLAAAKGYADSLAGNYDAAGTATTKVQELANGQVKANTDAIAKLNGDVNTDGSVDKKIADAKAGLNVSIAAAQSAADKAQGEVDAVEGRMDTAEGDITTMKGQIAALEAGTYDDSEVRGLIQTNADDIDAAEVRLDAAEAQLTTLIGDDSNKSVRTIANEELAKQLIAENAAENLNELQEIAAWIQSHPNDASAMNKAITDLEALVGALPEGVTATTVVGYIQEVVAAEKARAEQAEAALSGRVSTIEGNIGTGKVDDRIATAKQEAIDAAAGDAAAKDAEVLAAAKAHAEGLVEGVDLSGIAANSADITGLKSRMDTAEGDIDKLEEAIGENGSVTQAIADAKAAGTTAQAQVTELGNTVTTLSGTVTNHGTTLSAHGDRLTALEEKVGDGFKEITNAEIDAMF